MQDLSRRRSDQVAQLTGAGLPAPAVSAWLSRRPQLAGDIGRDAPAFAAFWHDAAALRAQLPPKPARNPAETAAHAFILASERTAREEFLGAQVEAVYRKLSQDYQRFIRVERLAYDAAAAFPGLTPTEATLAGERERPLKEKDGLEIDQGLLFAHALAHPVVGPHLCQAMLLPLPGHDEHVARFKREGRVDLGEASVERKGKAAVVEIRSPRFLNALDDAVLAPLEAAIDVAILDPDSEIAVLRGSFVDHPKYRRRIFCAGLNLTHLYYGKVSYLFYLRHHMGFEHKMFRGLARSDAALDELGGTTMEKPWIAVVDSFAIGGGCQILLVADYVLAADDAYLTLPARKEGIIPGLANLRLPRFTGDRIARQAILYGRRLDCASPEGRLVCDEIAPAATMDPALAEVVENFTGSGLVSAVANRRQFRIGQEPLDLFRRYLASYAREQAYCHFHPALVQNLERHWNAKSRQA